MKKVFISIVLITACTSCQTDVLQTEVYRADTGYGYRITEKGKILIQQSGIPSYPGNKKFCDSLDALKVGNEVIKLLRKNKIPAITADDLQRLNIKLKC